jgi:hypothetical protein
MNKSDLLVTLMVVKAFVLWKNGLAGDSNGNSVHLFIFLIRTGKILTF